MGSTLYDAEAAKIDWLAQLQGTTEIESLYENPPLPAGEGWGVRVCFRRVSALTQPSPAGRGDSTLIFENFSSPFIELIFV